MPRASYFMNCLKCTIARCGSRLRLSEEAAGMETLYAYLAGAIDIDGRISSSACMDIVVAVMGDRSPTIRRL